MCLVSLLILVGFPHLDQVVSCAVVSLGDEWHVDVEWQDRLTDSHSDLLHDSHGWAGGVRDIQHQHGNVVEREERHEAARGANSAAGD